MGISQELLRNVESAFLLWAPVAAAKMGQFMKPGKVVLVLAGRDSGRKAVLVKNTDDGP